MNHVLAFPGRHRHGPDAGLSLGRNIKQFGIDLAAVQNTVKKFPLIH